MYENLSDLPIVRIDAEDISYKISNTTDLEDLYDSVREVGLINSPILIQHAKKYTIISGFKRLQVVRRLGWVSMRARVLPSQTSRLQCARIAIADNTAIRTLNILEQARALKLLKTCISEREVLIPAAQKLGLPLNQALIEKLALVNRMNAVLQKGLESGAVALPVAIRIHHWHDSDAAQSMGRMLAELNLSLNRQREMTDWIEGILSRDKVTLNYVLSSLGIDKIIGDRDLDRRRKVELIRAILKKKRYPAIVGAEQRYNKLLETLRLPSQCQILAPPFFEGTVFSIKIDFSNLPQLTKLLDDVRDQVQRREMLDLMSPHKPLQ